MEKFIPLIYLGTPVWKLMLYGFASGYIGAKIYVFIKKRLTESIQAQIRYITRILAIIVIVLAVGLKLGTVSLQQKVFVDLASSIQLSDVIGRTNRLCWFLGFVYLGYYISFLRSRRIPMALGTVANTVILGVSFLMFNLPEITAAEEINLWFFLLLSFFVGIVAIFPWRRKEPGNIFVRKLWIIIGTCAIPVIYELIQLSSLSVRSFAFGDIFMGLIAVCAGFTLSATWTTQKLL